MKSEEILNALSLDLLTFKEAFKNKDKFLMTIRFGFFRGNLYVFSWKPFLNAIKIWPNEKEIWIQLIRFIVIYPNHAKHLDQVIYKIKKGDLNDLTMKNVISQVKFIQKSRNMYLTSDLKHQFCEIDNIITNIKAITVNFWNEISGGSIHSNSIYNISNKLKKIVDEVNKKYQNLLLIYHNNYSICEEYSKFMANILSDPIKGQFWHQRANFLKNIEHVPPDTAQEYGFDLFQFIPHHIQCIPEDEDFFNQFHSNESAFDLLKSVPQCLQCIPNEEKLVKESSKHIINENRFDFVQRKENNLSNSFKNEDEKEVQSHFRNLSLIAKVPSINSLIMISIIFFIISFICVPFIPPFTMIGTLNAYRQQFNVLKIVCELRISIMKEPYYMFFQAFGTLNEILAENFIPYEISELNDEIIKLNLNAEKFQKMIEKEIKKKSLARNYINSAFLEFMIHNKKRNVSFLEALNTIISCILHHDNPCGNYYNETWFQYIFNNIDKMELSLRNLEMLMCDDMNNNRNHSVLVISKILYAFIGIEFIFIPIFIYNAIKIRKSWNYLINTINTLPRVAIQKVIEKYSNEYSIKNNNENHQHLKAEFHYNLYITQMAFSRDTSGGLPISLIIFFFIIVFILSIVCIFAIIAILNYIKKDLTNVPMQYYTATEGIYLIYKYISVFLIKGYIDHLNAIPAMMKPPQPLTFSGSFGIFNQNYIHRGIEFITKQMSNSLDQIIFGDIDHPEKGILYSTSEIFDLVLRSNGHPYGYNDTITRIDLEQFPYFAGLSLFYESNLKFIEHIMKNPYFNSIIEINQNTFDMGVIFESIKLGTYHLIPKFLINYTQKTDERLNYIIDKTNFILFILSSGLFFVGLLAITFLNIIIKKIKKVFQFSLSLLSMVDPSFILEMPNIMNLFFGKMVGNVQNNQVLQNIFKDVESLVPEFPIELNSQMIITFISEKLINEWELERDHVVGSHIKLVLTFNDKHIFKELTKQANGSYSKEPKHFDTMITLNASNKRINVSFTSYHVPQNKDTKLVLMFGDSFNIEYNSKKIEEIQNDNNEMKIQVIPNKLRFNFDFNDGKNSFTSNYLIFCAIKVLNFDDHLINNTPKKTLRFMKVFENNIKSICENNDDSDAIYLKRIGNVFLIGFNFIQQNTNYFIPAKNSYEFVKQVQLFSKQHNYQRSYIIIIVKEYSQI